jgi:hypothetical protein
MEGIPQEILDQHRNRIIQNFYQAQEDRRIATGNPLPGQVMNNNRKKLKVEATSDLKSRLEEFRQQRKNAAANGGGDVAVQPPPANAPAYVSDAADSDFGWCANPGDRITSSSPVILPRHLPEQRPTDTQRQTYPLDRAETSPRRLAFLNDQAAPLGAIPTLPLLRRRATTSTG